MAPSGCGNYCFSTSNKDLDSGYILLIAHQKLAVSTKSSRISRPSSYASRTIRHAIDDPRSALKTLPTEFCIGSLLRLNVQYFFPLVCGYQQANETGLKCSTPLDIENGQCIFKCISLRNPTEREMYNSGHRDRDIYMYNAFFFSYRSLGNARHITRHTLTTAATSSPICAISRVHAAEILTGHNKWWPAATQSEWQTIASNVTIPQHTSCIRSTT